MTTYGDDNKIQTYESLLSELTILKMTNSNLSAEIKLFKRQITILQDKQRVEICKYFEKCNSLRETAQEFCFNDIENCYHALLEYYGWSHFCQSASDYKECYKEIFGREYDEDKNNDTLETIKKY